MDSRGDLSLIPKHRPSPGLFVCPNPLIFKAISILFEETSQQFESGASGGRGGGRREGGGRGRGRGKSETALQRRGQGRGQAASPGWMTSSRSFPPGDGSFTISESGDEKGGREEGS